MFTRRSRAARSTLTGTASRAVRLRAEQLELRDTPAITGFFPTMLNGAPQAPLGAAPLAVAAFTSDSPAAPASDFTATIDWGDGTTGTASGAAGTITADPNFPGQWNVLGNHAYAATGAYQATVTIQEAGGSTASVATPVIVASPSPLQVTPYDPATPLDALTNALVKPGTGLNVVGSSFVGQNGQGGTYTGFNFHDQSTTLSLPDGVLLTSGSAINALGPNNQTGATSAYGDLTNQLGDPRLDAMVAPETTFDANTFTLQFTTAPGVTGIQFQFVFGSEEFPEWVGQFNDVFAAFLDGKQISFDPAGNAISVNNNYFLLNNSNDNTYPAYSAGKTVVAYDIQYDGLTPALTTQAALDPNVTVHTLTFAIADTRDQVLDSGVFLSSLAGVGAATGGTGGAGGSGGASTAPAPQANAGGTCTVGSGGTVKLDASGTTSAGQDPATLTYEWDLDGDKVYGETGTAAANGDEVGMTPTFVANGLAAGTTVTVSLQVTDPNGVVSTDQATITVVAPPTPPAPPPVPAGGSAYLGQGPAGANTLVVVGTAGDDVIKIASGDKGAVKVYLNGVSQGVFAKDTFSSIAAYGLAGNDTIQVAGDVKAASYLFGGDGNDTLVAGGGATFLDGGAGNDKLYGGKKPSVLVGGTGADQLFAGDAGALLVAGAVDFANPAGPAASPEIADLLAAWAAPSTTPSDRAAAVKDQLAGHVVNDGAKDVGTGGDGQDLFFVNVEDVVKDRQWWDGLYVG
jgi:hypothetical protein